MPAQHGSVRPAPLPPLTSTHEEKSGKETLIGKPHHPLNLNVACSTRDTILHNLAPRCVLFPPPSRSLRNALFPNTQKGHHRQSPHPARTAELPGLGVLRGTPEVQPLISQVSLHGLTCTCGFLCFCDLCVYCPQQGEFEGLALLYVVRVANVAASQGSASFCSASALFLSWGVCPPPLECSRYST